MVACFKQISTRLCLNIFTLIFLSYETVKVDWFMFSHTYNVELSYYNAACLARVNIVNKNLLNSKTIELHQLSSVHKHDLTSMALWKKKKRVWKNKERKSSLCAAASNRDAMSSEIESIKIIYCFFIAWHAHSSVRCVDKSDDSLWEFFSSFFSTRSAFLFNNFGIS